VIVLEDADNAPEAAGTPLAGLTNILMGEGEIVRAETLAEYTRIVVRLTSGHTVEVLIHHDEAVTEGEAEEAISENEEGGSSRES
jgi:hypothetical protein